MLPVLPSPTLVLGPLAVPGQGLCVALGFAAGATLWSRSLRQRGLASAPDVPWIVLGCAVATWLGGRLLGMVLAPPPGPTLDAWLGGHASLGALLGAALASWCSARWLGVAWIRLVASATWPVLLAWLLVRFGCVLAHDHLGLPSTHPLAVGFPSGGRWDLGLLEWLALWPLLSAAFWASRVMHVADARVVGLVALAYAGLRWSLLAVAAPSSRLDGGLTRALIGALAAFGLWWLVVAPAAEPRAAEPSAEPRAAEPSSDAG